MARPIKGIWEAICGGALIVSLLILPFLRPIFEKWGSTQEELTKTLPGDPLVPDMEGWYNHAITIDAKTVDVWPWIVQLGQNKGGFYSYEYLENMVGSNIHNVDQIVPEFLDTAVGDKVMITPKAAPYIVVNIQPPHVFVLQLRIDLQTQKTLDSTQPLPEKYQDSSWAFILEETSQGGTRLISRSRNDWNRSKANTFFYSIIGVISEVMDRKLLMGIKQRAEAETKVSQENTE